MALLARLDPWAPPLALMGLIFFLSAQPDLSSGLGAIDLVGRKIVHALEFALLCFLWWRALSATALAPRAKLLAFVITLAYAASDEYHQSFVEGRHASVLDVGIDAAGAGAALLAIGRRAS